MLALYHQQNTSDDYVLVSTNDINENNQSKSPNQQAQAKTFFTTLNAADLPAHRNINEFLNRCENSDDGINFLQDSEIQQRQQQQQEHLQQQQNEYQQSGNNYNYNQDPNLPEGQKVFLNTDTRSKSTKQSTTKQTSVPRTTLETGDEQSNQVEQVVNIVTGASVKTPLDKKYF